MPRVYNERITGSWDRDAFVIFDPKADSFLEDQELRRKKDRYLHFQAKHEIVKITEHVFHTAPFSFQELRGSVNAIDHLVYDVNVVVDGIPKKMVYRINTGPLEPSLLIEAQLYRMFGAHNLPAPKVYATLLRNTNFSYDFAVLEYIGSGSLEKLKNELSREQEVDFTSQAGSWLARAHQIKLPGFGNFSPAATLADTLRGVHKTWEQSVMVQYEETLYFLRQHRILSAIMEREIRYFLSQHQFLLKITNGAFLHGDYHDANILIDLTARNIAGAVDLSQSKIGDPAFDLAFYSTYYPPRKPRALLDGYFAIAPHIPCLQERLAWYQIRIMLSKLKLRKRFGYEERIQAGVSVLRAALDFFRSV